MRLNTLLLIILLGFVGSHAYAQSNDAMIIGHVQEAESKFPIEGVIISVVGSQRGVESNGNGNFQISVSANKTVKLALRRVGFQAQTIEIKDLKPNEVREITLELNSSNNLDEVVITSEKIGDKSMVRAKVEEFKLLPSISGNIENLLPSIALGTISGTGGELTSQYNVRGGNYDENLVYVNDFEIFRPQLIRNGQQEGLSFPNIDLIRDLSFSSGGFDSKYGDKMSSVLDIKYKRPDSTRASISASLLGATGHLEGSFRPYKNSIGKIRYLLGGRYKTTRQVLSSQEIKGEYQPDFVDLQGYLTYDFNPHWQLGLIGNFNNSNFNFIPEDQTTVTGTVFNPFSYNAEFEGQEKDLFRYYMGGASLTYLPSNQKNPSFIKFLASTIRGDERENFDILSNFNISILSPDFEGGKLKEVASLGQGIEHKYARNNLQSLTSNFELKSGIEFPKINDEKGTEHSHFIYGGIKLQNEHFVDLLNEWVRRDSAGYSTPFKEDLIIMEDLIKSENDVASKRYSGFIQETFTFKKYRKYEIQATIGGRASYWSFNDEWIISPRAQILFRPLKQRNPLTFKLAGGKYQQQPFYREMRRPNGMLNKDIKAQKSDQIVVGMTYDFFVGKLNPVKLRLITEIYYKKLYDLISYDITNVRVRYNGVNNATGYARGIDMRINGEFVNGFESWLNISFLQAREKIDGIQHQNINREVVEYIPRPSDQAFSLALFFQDYLPKNKNFKSHLQLTYGSGLSYSVPNGNLVFRNALKYKDYQRIDIGFSYLLWDKSKKEARPNSMWRWTRNAWMSAEIFNLMNIDNQSSTNWVKDFNNFYYSIPNRLTTRRLNLKFRFEF